MDCNSLSCWLDTRQTTVDDYRTTARCSVSRLPRASVNNGKNYINPDFIVRLYLFIYFTVIVIIKFEST